uniref:Uncharacterized protein n=1 Tax=Kuenenia stuttgartiensis TaxID=174633 RepID=Q1Q0Z0_KUEST|nr:unknown protein [Candidatus Kuenenia stuttgartiensis]
MKTRLRSPALSLRIQFQFLIGRMKTNKYSLTSSPRTKFQFLIGRMKTCAASKIINQPLRFNSS